MKIINWLLLLLLVAVAPSLTAQDMNESRLTPTLLEAIKEQPAQTHNVYVSLADHVDVRQLEIELDQRSASLQERAYEVITRLQDKAAATQPALIDLLRRTEGVEKESITPFWIANVVFFEASPAAIAAISHEEAVEIIDLDWPIEFYQGQDKVTSTLKLSNVENGLEAIGAPEMWAMGYTGYGQKVLIVDTGEEVEHPALFNNFAYHNRPLTESWATPSPPQHCNNDHGTHVTGSAVGVDRILRDTIGVAYEGEWMGGPIPLFECDYDNTVMDAFGTFQWALNPDNDPNTTDDMPTAINNSWGSSNPSTFNCNLTSVVNMNNALMAAGIAPVYAAGNDGPGSGTVGSPAMNNYDLVRFFSVGNLNANNPNYPIAPGSSRGPTVCSGTGSLKIKPEVSAPGFDVRSSIFNGNYASYTGTSMAAPHVSGAILILREAFPDLMGEDLMLALYFSAIDLGEEGEDNNYGMGIINLPAAFQYLVDEGHTPTPPLPRENDVVLLSSETRDFGCNEGVSSYIVVENIGTQTATSILVTQRFVDGQILESTFEWEVNLAPGDRAEIQLPNAVVPPGDYEYIVELTEVNGQPDPRHLNNRIKREVTVLAFDLLPAAVIGTASSCENAQVAVESQYSEEAMVEWYNAPVGGSKIGEGPVLLVDVEDQDLTVYAQISPAVSVGKADNSTGSTQFDDNSNGLVFDCYTPIIIHTVKAYADEAGGRIIRLTREDGSSLTKVVSLEEGENIIELDFSVPAGEDHELFLQAGKPLAFTLGGTSYPYSVENVIDIRRPVSGSGIFYHYFFDWDICYDYFCGRTPVEINVQPGEAPEVAISPTDLMQNVEADGFTVDFTGIAGGATSWLWSFGDGTTSTEQNPTHQFPDTGSYQVTLTIVGSDGCSNSTATEVTLSSTMVSTNNLLADDRLQIFPNPTDDQLFLSFEWGNARELQYYIVDLFGRHVSSTYQARPGETMMTISMAQLPAGTYVLVAESDEGRLARRVVKQ